MTAAAYSIPELTLISAADALGTWVEPTAAGWVYGGSPVLETDYFIHNTGSISKTFGGVSPAVGGMIFDTGADQSLQANEVFLIWVWHGAPNAMDTYANGGLRLLVGDAVNAFKAWAVLGSDTYPYGGWRCIPVDPAIAAEYTAGAPAAGVHRWFGMAAKSINAIAKGNPLAVDVSRYGRGTLQTINGDGTGYGTFAGAAVQDQTPANRWGLCQLIDGTFVLQGHFLMGVAGTAVDFRDSNRNVVIANTLKVQSTFNLFEVRHASSRVDWTNISIKALGTVSLGDFTVTDNADVNIDGCVFDSMGIFTLLSATDILNSTFRSCKAIIAAGAKLTATKVLTPTVAADASALVWNTSGDTDGKLDNMTFTKGTNAHHAVEIGTSGPLTFTLRGITFTGFNAADAQNDSVVYLRDRGSNQTWNISANSCVGTISIKKERATDTVNLTQDTKVLTVHTQDANTGATVGSVQVLVLAAAGGPYPFQASVTITRSGGTATVTHTAHGLATNDYVVIEGFDQGEYNGLHQITKVDADSYTFTVTGTPATPGTGASKTSTFVILTGTTGAVSGDLASIARAYASTQPYSGRARKATGTPAYKTAPISGSISAATQTVTAQMISDD